MTEQLYPTKRFSLWPFAASIAVWAVVIAVVVL